MRYENVKLKQLKDITKPGAKSPNWWFLINDAEDNDIKGYSNDDLSELKNHFTNNPEHTFVNVSGDDYPPDRMQRAVFRLITKDNLSHEDKETPKTNGQTKYVTNSTLNQDGQNDISNPDLVQIYEGCWRDVNASSELQELSENNKKDIATTFFIFKTRRM